MYNRELYLPRIAGIEEIKNQTPDVKLLRLVFKKREKGLSDEHEFLPGQFVQVSYFGTGEVPISIASSPLDRGFFELCVRRVGRVTAELHKMKKGDEIGIRGPYGNYFPDELRRRKHFIFVGGGCGLAPLRSLIKFMLDNPVRYPRPTILYGSRSKDDLLFREELYFWKDSGKADVCLSVERGLAEHRCAIGLVTKLFGRFKDLMGSTAFICGPSKMLQSVVKELINLRVREEDIALSLERYMRCGVGKCGHCYIKDKYVCTDGPVFSYKQLKDMGCGF